MCSGQTTTDGAASPSLLQVEHLPIADLHPIRATRAASRRQSWRP